MNKKLWQWTIASAVLLVPARIAQAQVVRQGAPPATQRFRAVKVSPVTNLGTAAPRTAVLKGRVNQEADCIGVVKRTPITTFRPLIFKENGMPVDPNRKITTPDGQTLTVKEAQDGQDSLERALNTQGYSLYASEDEQSPLLSVRPIADIAKFQMQSQKLKSLRDAKVPAGTVISSKRIALPDPARTATLLKAAEEARKQQAAEEWEADRYKGDANVRREKSFSLELGSSDWFAVALRTGIVVDASATERSVRANADLNATIIGNTTSLVHGMVDAKDTRRLMSKGKAPQIRVPGSRYKLHAEVSVLGVDLIAPIDQTGDNLALTQRYSKGIDFRYDIEIPIIPGISAVGSIGAHGEGGLQVNISSNEGVAFAVSPFVNSVIFAEAGVAVGFPIAKIEGGVGANLTLIDYQIDFAAGMAPTVQDYNGMPHYALSLPLTVSHNITAMKGNLHAFVRLGYWSPTFTNPFRVAYKNLFNADIVSWAGLQDNATLASYDAGSVLLPVPVSRP